MRSFLTLLVIGFLAVVFAFVCISIGLGINKMKVKAGGADSSELKLPIIMYHKVLNSSKGKYTVSEKQIREDFTAILDAGFTPVFMSEVIDWVDGKNDDFPEKPIVITFDDGHYNNLHYALPIAKELGVKFMIYPVTSYSKFSIETGDTDNPNYSHITWQQIRDAHQSGLVEFGNHTHNMHNFRPRYGVSRMNGECADKYAAALRKDIITSQEIFGKQCCIPEPNTFAYPFGKYNSESRDILLGLGFKALLTCTERVNTIRQNKSESLHQLGRFNRDGHLTTNQLIKKIL